MSLFGEPVGLSGELRFLPFLAGPVLAQIAVPGSTVLGVGCFGADHLNMTKNIIKQGKSMNIDYIINIKRPNFKIIKIILLIDGLMIY
jgi:hypothetical protein